MSKINTQDNKVFFRFTPNTSNEFAYWFDWDDKKGEPQRIEKTFMSLKMILNHFHNFSFFKLEFQKGGCIFCSNPFSEKGRQKPYVDHCLPITETEEIFWRKMFLDLSSDI